MGGKENGKRARREACERYRKLHEALAMALHCLLTACSPQEFVDSFSFLQPDLQAQVYELYTGIVAAVHKASKSEFNAICKDMKLKSVVSGIDKQLARSKRRSSRGDKKFTPPSLMVVSSSLDIKRSEAELLKRLLAEEEEHKSQLRAHINGMRAEIDLMDADGTHAPASLKQALQSLLRHQ